MPVGQQCRERPEVARSGQLCDPRMEAVVDVLVLPAKRLPPPSGVGSILISVAIPQSQIRLSGFFHIWYATGPTSATYPWL